MMTMTMTMIKKEMMMDKIRSKSLPVSKADSGTEPQRENGTSNTTKKSDDKEKGSGLGADSMDDLDDQDLDALNTLPDFSALSRLQTDPAASMVDEHDQNVSDKNKEYDAIPSKATAVTTSQSEGVIKPKVNQTASVPVAKSDPISNSNSNSNSNSTAKSNVMTKTPSKYKII